VRGSHFFYHQFCLILFHGPLPFRKCINRQKGGTFPSTPTVPLPAAGGLTYAQGPHAKWKKFPSFFKKIHSKYNMNKHVESLPKVDKSITFHYCTVICDVFRPSDVIFLKRQHKLYLFFCVLIFLKRANLRFSVNVQKPTVFQLQGASPFWPPDYGALPLDPAGGSAHKPPIKGASHLYLGASNSLTPLPVTFPFHALRPQLLWYAFATFTITSAGEVWVKVVLMKFGLWWANKWLTNWLHSRFSYPRACNFHGDKNTSI